VSKTIRSTVTAGALMRRDFRAWCDVHRVEFIERKGLLNSVFTIEADAETWQQILELVRRYG
jgi:hypothetical protein